jgi:hypothetical protein
VEDEVGAEHRGDRAGRADERHPAAGVDHRERRRRDQTADEVEAEVAQVTEVVLDVVPEDPQEQHVEAEVEDVGVEEHGRDRAERDDLVPGDRADALGELVVGDRPRLDRLEGEELLGDGAPPVDELEQLAALEGEHQAEEDADVGGDERPVDERRAPRRVLVADGQDHQSTVRSRRRSDMLASRWTRLVA